MKIVPVAETCELYCQYSSQTQPQPCYIELDCKSGEMSARYNAEIGNAVPFSVYHGHQQRWAIPCLKAEAANRLMEEISTAADRILAGYGKAWDGHNMVARFTDDAKEAIDEIAQVCSSYEADEEDGVQACDACDYLYDCRHWSDDETYVTLTGFSKEIKITAKTTDAEILEIVSAIESELESGVVLDNLYDYIKSMRDDCEKEEE